MITIEKLKEFELCNGNADFYSRISKDKQLLTGNDWAIIERLVGDYHLISNNLTSQEYKVNFEKLLKENIDSEKSIDYFKSMCMVL